jgi:hypothetical protein
MNLLAELEVWIKRKGVALVLSVGGLNVAIVSALAAFQAVLNLRLELVQKFLIPLLVFDLLVGLAACYYFFLKRGGRGGVEDPKPLNELLYKVVSASLNDVKWAAKQAVIVYGGYDVIPERVMLDWFIANKNGFYVVKRGDDANVGNLDILPLKPNTMKRFLSGELLEREMLGDCLFGPDEKTKVKAIYIESLVVPKHLFADDTSNSFALYAVIERLAECILGLCEPAAAEKGEIKVYALSANPKVAHHLAEMGFDIVSRKEKRRDGHDLYCLEFKSLELELKKLTDRRDTTKRGRKPRISLVAGL